MNLTTQSKEFSSRRINFFHFFSQRTIFPLAGADRGTGLEAQAGGEQLEEEAETLREACEERSPPQERKHAVQVGGVLVWRSSATRGHAPPRRARGVERARLAALELRARRIRCGRGAGSL